MNTITASKVIAAPQQAVWDVLLDFGNISAWNSGVERSYLTSDEEHITVGATRHCDLKPLGGLEETLRTMDEPNRAVISIDKTSKIPIKNGEAEFLLEPEGDGTKTTINYTYTPKGGPLAGLVAKLLKGQLTSGFAGFLDDLEAAAQAVRT